LLECPADAVPQTARLLAPARRHASRAAKIALEPKFHPPGGVNLQRLSPAAILFVQTCRQIAGSVKNDASMKPSLSRRAVKIVFVLFFVRFYRHLTTTHLFGFGA
jgi:hypothetical protein